MTAAHLLGLPTDAGTAAGAAVVATWAAALVQMLLVERRFAREVPREPPESTISSAGSAWRCR